MGGKAAPEEKTHARTSIRRGSASAWSGRMMIHSCFAGAEDAMLRAVVVGEGARRAGAAIAARQKKVLAARTGETVGDKGVLARRCERARSMWCTDDEGGRWCGFAESKNVGCGRWHWSLRGDGRARCGGLLVRGRGRGGAMSGVALCVFGGAEGADGAGFRLGWDLAVELDEAEVLGYGYLWRSRTTVFARATGLAGWR